MEILMGKSSTNGPFPMAMLNNQMVHAMAELLIPPSGLFFLKETSRNTKLHQVIWLAKFF